MIPKVYLDTNIFVEAFERLYAEQSSVWNVLQAIEKGEIAAMTSEITLAELLPKPLANEQSDLVALSQGLFLDHSLFVALPVTREVLLQAAQIRSKRLSLRLPDAVHLATAVVTACSAVLSNDYRLRSVGPIPLVPFGSDALSKIKGLAL